MSFVQQQGQQGKSRHKAAGGIQHRICSEQDFSCDCKRLKSPSFPACTPLSPSSFALASSSFAINHPMINL